jgi:hypothetical protein
MKEQLINEQSVRVPDIQLTIDSPTFVKNPEFKVNRLYKWVPYVDIRIPDNKVQFPDYLNDLANNSALHGAILASKSAQITGQGFTWDASEYDQTINTNTEEFLKNINDYEDANEQLLKVATDYARFGGFALKVVWSRDWTEITKIEHLDFSCVRSNRIDETGEVPGYWFSYDWTKQRSPKVYLPKFNIDTAKINNARYLKARQKSDFNELTAIMSEPTAQIYYYKPYQSGSFYYPLPDYIGALIAIETEAESDIYALSSLRNGLTADYIVTFFGLTTVDQQNEAAKKFLYQHTGRTKNNIRRPIITFAKNQETALNVEQIAGQGEDKRFTSINENTLQKILSGHRVTSPLLVGIKTEGQLGGATELQTASDLFYINVIKPFQINISKVYNKFMNVNGLAQLTVDRLPLVSEINQEQSSDNQNEIEAE